MQQMYEVAQCCSERLGRFQSAIYIWVLPVAVKLLCDCNGEVNNSIALLAVKCVCFSLTLPSNCWSYNQHCSDDTGYELGESFMHSYLFWGKNFYGKQKDDCIQIVWKVVWCVAEISGWCKMSMRYSCLELLQVGLIGQHWKKESWAENSGECWIWHRWRGEWKK